MKDNKELTMKEVLLRIKKNLEKIFMEVNATSEPATTAIIQCLKDLEVATKGGIPMKEESINRGSQWFANKHKEFCMKIGQLFEEKDLHYFIHLSDPSGTNTISYGHMEENLLRKSIAGAMIQSKMMFQGVLKELGMPPNCLECLADVPDNLKTGYSLGSEMPERIKHILKEKIVDGMSDPDMPEGLKRFLEDKFGGEIIAIGSVKIPKDELENEEGGKDEPST